MPTITITLPTKPHDAVRFHRYYNPESKTWELIRITEYHVGSYDAEDAPQSLSRFWGQVYFEPTHYNATRVYIERKYIADIVLARTEQGSKWCIDCRLQNAIDMPVNPGGFPTAHKAERAVLDAWKEKCLREGKKFP